LEQDVLIGYWALVIGYFFILMFILEQRREGVLS